MTPPRVPDWLLRRWYPLGADRDAIRGDLLEELRRRHRLYGAAAARAWYWREVLSLLFRGHRYTTMLTIDNLRQDLKYAWRSSVKTPGFTALVVATLALGIGASTAIFSIVNGILLRPLPFPEPDRLLWISEANARGQVISASWMNYGDWRERARSFDVLAASRGVSFTITGVGQARQVPGRMVTANFFTALGAQPFLGRGFGPADDVPGAPQTAVISYRFWRRLLGGDPHVVGHALVLDARPVTIVGVLPQGFRYLRDYDVFTSLGWLAGEDWLKDRGNHQGFVVIGRLTRTADLTSDRRELTSIEEALSREYPATNASITVMVERLSDRLVTSVRQTLLVLLGAVGMLLLIACVNVAGLLMARGSARQHEMALRSALGGKRLRLVTQLLVESSLVSFLGGVLGIALAVGLLRVLVAVAPEGTPRLEEVSIDATALLFATVAAVGCGLLFGAFPAAQVSRANAQQALVRARTAGSSAASHRIRRALLIAELAMALVLLTGAGLMIRTLTALTGTDPGFRPDHVLTLHLSVPEVRRDNPHRVAVVDDLLARINALPGVTSSAVGYSLPIDGSNWNSVFWPQDKPVPASHENLPSAAMIPVSPGYFDALGVRVLRGRAFTAADRDTSQPVVVVNETLAARIWPGQDAVGQQIKQGWPERQGTWREVVGVVGDVKFDGITERTPMQVYMPFAQEPPGDFSVVVRSSVPPQSLTSGVEAAVAAISKDMPIADLRTMDALVNESISRQRMARLVLTVFAAIAVLLASIGLFGLVSHGVTERRHEIGVRLALGAERRDVLRLVLAGGVLMTLAGISLGLAGAAVVSRALEELLFGVKPLDGPTFAATPALLLAVSLVACAVPAWRATRIAPATALRAE